MCLLQRLHLPRLTTMEFRHVRLKLALGGHIAKKRFRHFHDLIVIHSARSGECHLFRPIVIPDEPLQIIPAKV